MSFLTWFSCISRQTDKTCSILSPLTSQQFSAPSLIVYFSVTEFVPPAYEYIFIFHILKKSPLLPHFPLQLTSSKELLAPPAHFNSFPTIVFWAHSSQSFVLPSSHHFFFQSHIWVKHCLADDMAHGKVRLEQRKKLGDLWMTATPLNPVVNSWFLSHLTVSSIGHSWQHAPPW